MLNILCLLCSKVKRHTTSHCHNTIFSLSLNYCKNSAAAILNVRRNANNGNATVKDSQFLYVQNITIHFLFVYDSRDSFMH